jgi:hypothetical protein
MAVVNVANGVVGDAELVDDADEPTKKSTNNIEQSCRDASQKTLSPASRCRISMDGVSEACSPGWVCTQSLEWGRLEDDTTKETGQREREASEEIWMRSVSRLLV